MKNCWFLRYRLLDPVTGDVMFKCWRIRREWFWLDALDVSVLDAKERQDTHPDLSYDLIEIKEV